MEVRLENDLLTCSAEKNDQGVRLRGGQHCLEYTASKQGDMGDLLSNRAFQYIDLIGINMIELTQHDQRQNCGLQRRLRSVMAR